MLHTDTRQKLQVNSTFGRTIIKDVMARTYPAATDTLASQVLLPIGTGSPSSHLTNVEAPLLIPYLHLFRVSEHVRGHDGRI